MRSSLIDVAKIAAEDLLDLVAAQIKLARLELAADLRASITRVVWIALFIPPLVVGYAFGMAAIASWLAGYWGRPAALACIAGLQIVPAGVGILWSLSALKRTQVLERSTTQIAASAKRSLAAVSNSNGTRLSDG